MFQLEKIDSLFNCEICQNVLEDPVILPCGHLFCQKHTEEINKTECMFCSEKHKAPMNKKFAKSTRAQF